MAQARDRVPGGEWKSLLSS
uniref:Uncharacterized protein n=1 Tax=Anguilla anguilla TaxID=7936 RepID=A0A0E9PLV5_ANGAN